MQRGKQLWVGVCLVWGMGGGMAVHAQQAEVPRNVVQLSATGQVEVEQDWLQMNLRTTHEGSSAAAVQKRLQQVVDEAMRSLKPQVQGQELQLRTGSFGVAPRQDSDGKIKGWQGSAELVLEGKDFARISQAAAQVPGMSIASMGFGLSKEGSAKVQELAQAEAVENFRARAGQLAKQFGFKGYSLREVHVSTQDGGYAPRMQRTNGVRTASISKMEAADPVPVEAGKTRVMVNVSGGVQLQ